MGLERAVSRSGAPLEVAAVAAVGLPVRWVLAVGAVTALLGVLLNLVLGLTRVVLAMARRGDMPRVLGRLCRSKNPSAAIVSVSVIVALPTLLADIQVAWSFSAVTVVTYTGLAAFVDENILLWALVVAAAGFAWFEIASTLRRKAS